MSKKQEYNKVTPQIVKRIAGVVSEKYVTTSKPILYSYVSKGIMGLESCVADCVVRPKSVEEVQGVLKIATEESIPVTPASGGLSGGFACPTIEPGGILMDLGEMNKIIEVDTDARYIVVEPGVRSGEVWAYMKKKYPGWAPPVPDGAPPAATILGDAIERGFSLVTGRYGPQADTVMGMEVVLATGDVIRTGSWALPGAKPFYKWGIGPDIGGLFLGSQGTMGVITKCAIKIMPHLEHKTVVAYGMDNPYDMQDLTLEVSKYEMGIADHCVMVQGGNWPLIMTRWPKERVPNDYEAYEKMGISKWWMNFEVWAWTKEELDYTVKKIDEVAKSYEQRTGHQTPQWKLHPKQIASRLLKPNKIAIPYALWNAGFLFITWYTPWKGCAEFSEIYCQKMQDYGFPPVMWVASIDHAREAICMPIVCYDATSKESIENVTKLNRETTEIFLDKGWLNYRPDPFVHAPLTFAKAKEYYSLLRKIKKLLDPKGILHPGRLGLP
nr:FAD-binding oxidoreductase [Candidatus Njordarchaeum guaymaensis]